MTLEELDRAEKEDDGHAYRVAGYDGVAWRYAGRETQSDEDTFWTGIEEETGMAEMVMVGDDRVFSTDPDDVSLLAEEDFCGSCGQVGCSW